MRYYRKIASEDENVENCATQIIAHINTLYNDKYDNITELICFYDNVVASRRIPIADALRASVTVMAGSNDLVHIGDSIHLIPDNGRASVFLHEMEVTLPILFPNLDIMLNRALN